MGAWAFMSSEERLAQVRTAVEAAIVAKPVLAPGESIEYEGQVVIQNNSKPRDNTSI